MASPPPTSLNDYQGVIVRGNVLDLSVLPEIAVEGVLGAGHMDPALCLGGPVLIGEANEATLALGGVVEPGGPVPLELEVNETGGSVLRDGDCVLGITAGMVRGACL